MAAIIKREHVSHEAAGVAPRHTDKSIRVIQNNGEVFAVELTCSCGDVSVIELVHSEMGATPNTSTETPS